MKATRLEAIDAYRRILKVVYRMTQTEHQDALRTDGRGMWTWREVRAHIRAALELKIVDRRIRRGIKRLT